MVPAVASDAPVVVQVSSAADPRVKDVEAAVAHWNETLAGVGARFRFGDVEVHVGPLPERQIVAASDATLRHRAPDVVPMAAPGLVIVLSDADFVSFTIPHPSGAVVALKTDRAWPLSLPNVARNVVAHELGHVLGFGHDDDPALLMCGRPAACRPDVFAAPEPRWFPLSSAELAALAGLSG